MTLSSVDKPRDPLAALRIQRAEPPRRTGRLRRWLRRGLMLLLLLALIAAGVYAASKTQLKGWVESLQPRLVVRVGTVNVATGRSGDALVVATGYIESRRQARIGARAAGRIEVLQVEEGTPVESGHLLAVLEHADLEAALAAAKATLARSQAEVAEQEVEIARTQRNLEREEALRKNKASSEQTYDQARFAHQTAVARRGSMAAAVLLAEARVREAEQMNENMFIRAPFAGTVISKDAELGESILPGGMGEASGRGSVATIADLEHLEVECDVKEDYIGRVRIDQPTEIRVDAVPDRRYTGRVRKIIPMGDRARATIKVKVEIVDADSRLFPEMSSTVYFLPDQTEAPAVPERRVYCPADAVVTAGPESSVWVVDDQDRVQRTAVKAGTPNDGQVEILDGLKGGERVVLRPPVELQPGLLVEPAE